MIYELTSCLDDPRFPGFDGNPTLFRSIAPNWKSLDFEVKRLREGWQPPIIKGAVQDINHYPCVALNKPVFSAHAARYLADILEPNGELLPIITPKGEYYFYNLLTIADVLDPEKSEMNWLKRPLIAGIIKRHEFFPDRLGSLMIFRIPQSPFDIYVSHSFVEAALRHNLTGLRFTKVWPTSPREKPQVIEAPVTVSKRTKSAASTQKEAQAESVYMDVYGPAVLGDMRVINYEELEEDLSTKLEPAESGDFAIGHVEYCDEETVFRRFFLSCPNANALAKWLDRYLRERGIRQRVRILARYDPYDNVEAPSREVPA